MNKIIFLLFKKLTNNDLTFLLLSQFFNLFFPIIILSIILNNFSLEAYTSYQYSIVISSFIILLSQNGYSISVPRSFSVALDKMEFNKLIIRSIFTSFVISVLSYAVCTPIYIVFNFNYFIYFLLSIPLTFSEIVNPIWLFQISKKLKFKSVLVVIKKLLFVILLLINLFELSLIIIIYNFIVFLISFLILIYILDFKIFRISYTLTLSTFIKELTNNFTLSLNLLLSSFFSTFINLVLGFFIDSYNLGIYFLADKIIRVGVGFVSPIYQYTYPKLIYSFNKDIKALKTNIYRYLKLFSTIFILGILLIFTFSDFYLQILTENSIQFISITIKILSPLPIFILLNNFLGLQFLSVLKKELYLVFYLLFIGLFHLFLSVFLGLNFGFIGLALSSLISEFVFLLVIVITFVKITKIG